MNYWHIVYVDGFSECVKKADVCFCTSEKDMYIELMAGRASRQRLINLTNVVSIKEVAG